MALSIYWLSWTQITFEIKRNTDDKPKILFSYGIIVWNDDKF